MRIYKKLLIIFIIIISSILCTSKVYAAIQGQTPDVKGQKKTDAKAVIDVDSYDPNNKEEISDEAKKLITSKVGWVLGGIRNITVIMAVITLMLIGVKYIIGSANEKAKYKETLFPWVIGCIVSVTGTTLISFIYDAVT